MKKRTKNRVIALFMAVLLVIGLLPSQLGGIQTQAAEGKTYVLETSSLTAVAEGDYSDAQEVKMGTEDFFTAYMSAKTKIDSSSKTWSEPAYSSSQRLSLGGKLSKAGDSVKNAIGFTTTGAATVKIWWAQGGDDSRQWGIYKPDFTTIVAQTEGTYTKNTAYYSELELTEAGSYYLGGVTNNNYLFKVEVVVEGATTPENVTTTYNFAEFTGTIEGGKGTFGALKIDATTGKVASHQNDCAQFNEGAIITVPVYGPSTITVTSHHGGQYALYTINGEQAKTDATATSVEYTGEAGTIDIVSTGGAYITSIEVVGPKPDVEIVTTTYNFEELVSTIEGSKGRFQGLAIDATIGKLAPHQNDCAQFNEGAIITVPVYGPSTITVTSHHGGSYALYTINGEQAKTDASVTSVEYTGGEGTIDIVSTGGAYITSIEVYGPAGEAKPLPPIVNTATAVQKPEDPSGATVTITVTGTAGDEGTKYTIEASSDEGANWKAIGTIDGTKTSASTDVILTGYGTYIFRVKGENTVEASGSVVFAAAAADTDKVNPSLENWTSGQMAAETVGQKITLTNEALAITGLGTNIKTSGLGMFVFPATIGNNKLSVDLLVNDAKGSVMVGLFNESVPGDDNGIRLITAAIRNNNNEIVNLMSKTASEVIGKNSYKDSVTGNTPTMEVGDVINVTVSRDGSDIIFEVTNKTQKGETYTMKRAYSNCAQFLNPGGEVYYGIMVSGKTAVVTNMVYTNVNGAVLYDQNEVNAPKGTAPAVNTVTGVASEDRTYVNVSWTGDTAEDDEKFILEVLKPGKDTWELVSDEITAQTYKYPIAIEESGDYKFRVSGTLGNSAAQKEANKTAAKESEKINVRAALPTPELTLEYVSGEGKVNLSWTASEGANNYQIYRGTESGKLELLAETTKLAYVDENVEAEGVYYYVVKALSADNFSPDSAEKWTLVSKGHKGDYSEEATITITERSNNTVLTDKINLKGTASAAGTLKLYVNDEEAAASEIATAGGAFEFKDIDLTAGRNKVELILSFGEGKTTRVVMNYVYLVIYDIVVDASIAKSGTEDENGIAQYKTIAEALEAAKELEIVGNIIIFIKNGDYNEQLAITQKNISLIGEDSIKTRIYYSAAEATRPEGTGYEGRSAFFVAEEATGFSAENLTIENTWPFEGKGSDQQAEALYIEAEEAVFVGVRFLSYQDTINQKNNSSYFLRCYVLGLVDYMWGVNAKALYEDCDLVFRYNADKNSGYYTAYDPTSQVVYKDCRFTGEKECSGEKYYLGRPYNGGTNITLIDSYIGTTLNKEVGWTTWGQQAISTNKTDYANTKYFESGSYGPGYEVNINRRQLSASAATALTTVSGLGWDPYSIATEINIVYGGDEYEGPIINGFNAGELTAKEDQEAIVPGTTLANDTVTVVGTVKKRIDSKGIVKTIELAKAAGGSLDFDVTGTATFTIKISSNGDNKPTKVELVDANGNPVADSEGRTVVELDGGDKKAIVVTYRLSKGNYSFRVPEDYTERGVRVYSFTLTTVAGDKDIPQTSDINYNGIYFIILLGAALVTVAAVQKKRFTR